MRIIKGNKKIDLTEYELKTVLSKYSKTMLDIGTGDGRYVYKNAQNNRENLYIGLDPSEKSLEEYSKKAVKSKTDNVLFVVGSFEIFPKELTIIKADEISIILPWGSLLQAVANPTSEIAARLKNLIKPGGTLKLLFGYDSSLEPSETKRLNLFPITAQHVEKNIIPVFQQHGFSLGNFSTLCTDKLKEIESTWGKKIATRQERPLFMLIFLRGN
ncbi:methyltransferase domain-containing protein [candidate division WWE3 bacterium]|uniref:Methyltransferase domain-containing protein n=1 Tax=candidate division WWE3 bacterium TaxID=2053526 RepID=A0A7X9DL08_UNCKA|nr:methyltransferase domain-containing protein [candidate division WWE3 bacterium]